MSSNSWRSSPTSVAEALGTQGRSQLKSLLALGVMFPSSTPCKSMSLVGEDSQSSDAGGLVRGMGWIVSPRDIVGCQDTIFDDDGTVWRVQCSVNDSAKPPVSGKVRATLTVAGWVLRPNEQGIDVTYIVKSKLCPLIHLREAKYPSSQSKRLDSDDHHQ